MNVRKKFENPKKLVNIAEKILGFIKQQKGKGLSSDLAKNIKELTPKQMLQRLPITLVKVKADDGSYSVS